MSTHRRLGLFATLLLAATGSLAVPAGSASASATSVVITAGCSANSVNITHTITVNSDGSWVQQTRAHNGAGTRRHVQARTYLYPTSAGGGSVGSFTSSEVTLGAGLFSDDTKTWTNRGSNAGWIPWFGDLRGGGRSGTQCLVSTNFFNPSDFDGFTQQSRTWAPQ